MTYARRVRKRRASWWVHDAAGRVVSRALSGTYLHAGRGATRDAAVGRGHRGDRTDATRGRAKPAGAWPVILDRPTTSLRFRAHEMRFGLGVGGPLPSRRVRRRPTGPCRAGRSRVWRAPRILHKIGARQPAARVDLSAATRRERRPAEL